MKNFYIILLTACILLTGSINSFAGDSKRKIAKRDSRGEHQIVLSWQKLHKRISTEKKRRKKRMRVTLSF